nr:hypothetical protein [Tanacetum cinerariifolium]
MCLVRGMLIQDAFLTKDIRATNDFKEYETVFMNVDVLMNLSQLVFSTQGTHRQQKVVKGNKDDDDSENRLDPGSHKDNPKHVDDDDDKDVEKIDEEEGGEMGSLETRTEKMQTPISTPSSLPRTILSSDKNITTTTRMRSMVEETIIDEDEVISKDETPELITELQDIDKRVLTIFDYERMKATLNDALSNQFKDAEEYAYHLEQTTNFMENQIFWESRQEDIRRPVPRPLVFFGPQQNPNEPPRYLYNNDLFFLNHGNTKEKKYDLSLYKIHAERFPKVDLEEYIRKIKEESKTIQKTIS